MKHMAAKSCRKILSLIVVMAIILSGVPLTAAAEDANTATAGVTATDNSAIGLSGEIEPDNGEEEQESDPVDADDNTPVATSGNTDGGLFLDDGGEETCICTAFQSDPDCPVCKDDATQCFFYYCVCEALCEEENINTECPICKDDYTSCVQAVEVPELAAMAAGNVTDAATLRAAASSSGSGDIVLSNDISITDAVSSAGLLIERTLTLDLNGYNLTITLDATTGVTSNGIKIETGATLTIEDSNPGENKLTVINGATALANIGFGAAINVTDGEFTIKNGNIVANGGYGGAGIGGGQGGTTSSSGTIGAGGKINILGGTVTATGKSGACIGGGRHGDRGTINISGGTVTALSSYPEGAGIGDGRRLSNYGYGTITISGNADVTVKGGGNAAGIGGGGNAGNGGTIRIEGNAKVKATGISGGAAIGGGTDGSGGTVTITNADKVEAMLEHDAGNRRAIGRGNGSASDGTVTVSGPYKYWIDSVSNTQPTDMTSRKVFDGDTTTFAGQKYVLLEKFVPTYGISLNPSGNKDFGSATYGYAAQTAHSVTVNNTGDVATGALTVALSGWSASSFTLSKTSITDIAVGDDDSFTVVPNTELDAGTYAATVTVSGNNGISESFNVSFEVTKANQAALSITGLAGSYTYGQTPLTLGTTGGSGTGVVTYVSSNTSVATVSGNTVTIVGAGNFTITATKAGDGNYNDVSVTSGSVTVNPKTITVTAAADNKTYDGNTTATVTLSSAGFVGTDGSNITIGKSSATFSDKNAANGKTVTVSGISLSGTGAGNYTLSSNTANATANITAKAIAAISQTDITYTGKTYDGTTSVTGATITLTNANSGIISGDTVTASYSYALFDNANAGTTRTVTFTGIVLTGGTDRGNYSLTNAEATKTNVTISKAAAPATDIPQTLTFTQGIAASQSVDLASLLPTLTSPASYGTVSYTAAVSDGSGILSAPSAGTVSSPLSVGVNAATAGQSATVTVTVSSTNYGNFTITINVGVTAKTATTVTVTAPTTGLTYGSTPIGDPSAVTSDTVTDATFTYNYTGTLADGSTTYNSSTKPTEPGNYTVTATLDSATHSGTGNATFSISKKTLTWQTSGTAADKTYDGNKNATQATAPTLSGIINSDTVSVNAGTLAFANANAGTGKTVTASDYGISGTHAWKYNAPIAQPGFGTANITAKAITITPDAGQSKAYGSADPTLTYTSSEALIAGNSFSGALSRATGENVGTYAINLGTLSAGSNYTLTLSATPVNFTINKAAYTGTKTASAEVRAGKATTNATLILPTLPEGSSYPASGTISGALVSSNSITGRQLTYSTISQATGTTATITIPVNNATNYSDYNVTVTITARDATATEKVAEDLDALTFADIKNANIVPNDVTTDLTLISIGTVHSSAIAWTSNHSAINVTNGAVTRQSSDTAVILTATITNGAATSTKIFRLTVTAAPPPTGNIGGTVTDEGGTTPMPNLTVKIMIGGSVNGTVVGSTTTNASGVYGFTNLPYGVYSLVVYDGTNTVTRLIIINSASVTENVKMPAGNQNTYVEVNGNDTPSVATGNLEEMFTPADIAAAQEAGASVEIKLVVEQVQSPPDANIVLQTLGSGKELGFYLDAQLLKTITGSANDDVDGEKIQPPTGTTLTVVIDLPPELWNLAPYSIIRVHGSDVKTITADYDSTLHTLTFEADLFSTYAIAYTSTSPNPPIPPTSPSSSGNSSSSGGGGGTAPAIISTYWIEKAEAKTMAKSAKEQGAEIARSRRSTITGIRKASLLLLSESGLRYQHDTVANNAVQVRVYVNDPSLATKDILVSGYVTGDTVDKTKAIFGKWYPNKIAVVSFDAQGDFGMKVEVAAKVDLSGMDTSKLYFYSYNKAANKYKRILTEYRIDTNGYLHFATTLAGSIIITDAPLSGNAEPQNPGTGGDGAAWDINDLQNPNTGGDGMITPPMQVQPQASITADTLPEAATVDSGVLKLESRTVPAAINNTDGETGGALVFDLDAHAESAKDKKINVWLIGGIGALMLLIAVTVSWVIIPRRNDPLLSVEEYRKKQ